MSLQNARSSTIARRNVVAAQRRVARAIAELSLPAGFSVLIETMAQEMVAHNILPGTPTFESFIRLQIGALVDRTRGVCAELGVEIDEEIEEVPTRRVDGSAGGGAIGIDYREVPRHARGPKSE